MFSQPLEMIAFFTGAIALFLGIMVITRQPKKLLNLSFGFYCLCIAILSALGFLVIQESAWSLIELRMSFALYSLMPCISLIWINEIVGAKGKKREMFLIFFLGFIFVYLSLFTDFVLVGFSQIHFLGYHGEYGPLAVLYSLYFLFLIALTLRRLYRYYHIAESFRRSQIKYALWGMGLYGFFAYFFSSLLPTFFNNYNFTALDIPSALFLIGFSTAAIMRHRLFGFKVIYQKVLYFSFIIPFVVLSHYLIYYIIQKLFGTFWSFSALMMIVMIVFALVFLYIFLLRKLKSFFDFLVYGGLEPKEYQKQLALKLAQLIHPRDIYLELSFGMRHIFAIKKTAVIIFKRSESGNVERCFPPDDFFILGEKFTSLFKEEFENNKNNEIILSENGALQDDNVNSLLAQAKKLEFTMICPFSSGDIYGAMLLGQKHNQEAFAREEIVFMENLAEPIGKAFANAMFVESLKAQLQQTIATKKRFREIVSDQVRTPIFIIHNLINLAKSNSVITGGHEDYLSACAKRAAQVSESLDNIVLAAKLDEGEFEFDFGPVDIVKLLKHIIKVKGEEARARNLYFKANLPNKDIFVFSHKFYLEQIFINLINNAINYTKEGGIEIILEEEGGKVIFTIKDTGVGIPSDNLDSVFNKFTRNHYAPAFNESGAGLGLYLVKQIVERHENASICIKESQVNKGTTMVVELSKYDGEFFD